MTYTRENGGMSRSDMVPRWPLYRLEHEEGMVRGTVLVRALTVVGTAEGERVMQVAAGVNLGRSREENRRDLHHMQGKLVADLVKKLENEEMGATR